MKSSFSCLLWLVLAAIGYGAINPGPGAPRFTAKELAQGYREHVILAQPRATERATVDDAETREHVRVRERFSRFGDLRIIDLDDTDSADAAIQRLKATGRYQFVEPDYLRTLQATPNDPKFTDGSLWQFNNTGQAGSTIIGVAGADIKATQAWDIIHDAPNVIVAVVDTGINLTHQDLTSGGVSNLWTNPSPTNGDVHGANFVGGKGSLVSGDPTDDDGHGTHVAGTIGAIGNNGTAVTGVAWRVQLMAVKVFPPNANGSISEIAAGIKYAIDHGANIINASYGGTANTGYSQTELSAINAARNAGIIVVAAAGNDTANMDVSRFYPASYPLDNVVTVGASNRRDELASYSNYGAAVDLFAPGDDIVSLNYANNTGTVSLSGTSMAAPHVSGSLALLMAEFPTDTYRQLINRLLRGAEHGVGDKFAGKAQTGGRLNLYKALTTTTNTPFNDNFADRPHFTSDNLAIRSNNTGATTESAEPNIAGIPATATLWWEWTAPASGTVSVDTNGSAYDTVLGVFTGTAVNGLTAVASNDNDGSNVTSRLTFAAQAGTTYEIGVGSKNGVTGLTLLNIGTTPANDAFASPVTLSGVSASVTATNAHCSREVGEPKILGFAGGTSLWYQWTAPSSGRFQVAAVSTDFDPLLAVYTGTSLTALSLIDSSQTSALCTINATAGTTYMITVDSKDASTVGQFTLTLVDSAWQAKTGSTVTGGPAVGPDGTVYVGSTDHLLYAFASDGTQKWTYSTGGFIDSCSPAVADDGTVYVGSADGKLYAVNSSGSLKWSHDFKSGTTPVSAACSPAVGADGTIYLRITDGYLYALNRSDGSVRWKANINATGTSYYGNPVIAADGTIYQGSDEIDNGFYAFNAADGSQRWRFSTTSGIYGAPAIDASGNIYIGALTGRVYRLNANGTEAWHADSGGNISSSMALSSDGSTLYYAGYDAKVYARDTATGAVRWTSPLGAEVRASSPAVDANGVIYIGCYDDKVYAIKPDGTQKRVYDTGNWVRSAPAISGNRLYVGSNDQKVYAFDINAGPASGPWPQYRFNARRIGRAVTDTLGISVQPQSQTAMVGSPLTLSVVATGLAPLTYQWSKDGTAISGATNANYTVANVTSATAGSYTVAISGPQGKITSSAATITIGTANPGRLVNLSVRTTAGTGSQTLIVGFTVSGSTAKPLLIRGIGPSLVQYGVSDALTYPQLTVLSTTTTATVATNNKWGGGKTLSDAFASVGAFPLDAASNDDAVLVTLPPAGAAAGYTAQITGANNSTGTALAEVYDMDPTTAGTTVSRLTNLSARAQVGTGGNVLIAGFAISGNMPKQLLIRGIGPALTAYGVGGVLAAPKLDVYSGSIVVKSNSGWGGDATLTAAFTATGAFPLNNSGSKDAALLITLQPGSYTAQVSGVNSTTGVALIEVYEMP